MPNPTNLGPGLFMVEVTSTPVSLPMGPSVTATLHNTALDNVPAASTEVLYVWHGDTEPVADMNSSADKYALGSDRHLVVGPNQGKLNMKIAGTGNLMVAITASDAR